MAKKVIVAIDATVVATPQVQQGATSASMNQ